MKNKSIASLSLRKLILSVLVAAPLATLPTPLWALPSSATNLANQVNAVSSGVSVAWGSATQVNVTSTSTYGVVKWNDFGDATNMTIGNGDTITYAMPSSTSGVLNMVVSSGASHATTINGTLTAPGGGNIWVLNPNGITIGATGVISATGVGLSTVPETEYNFLANGTLTFVQNQTSPAGGLQPISLQPGARITAASGSGNVWIVSAANESLAGTIDAGNVTTTAQNGNLVLGSGGSLTIGDASAKAGALSASATGTGTITIGDAVANSTVTVIGPSASLTTGNTTISQTGTGAFVIGAGGTSNSTLTTNSGTAATSLNGAGGVVNNNNNTLTVNATGAGVTVSTPTGALAIGATSTAGLTASTGAGNLTINAGNVSAGAVSISTTSGNIIAGGALAEAGGITLTVASGKNVAFTGTGTLGAISIPGTPGNVTLTNASGSLVVPTLVATANFSATATGNITQAAAATQTVTGNATYTSSGGNITFSSAVSSANLTVTTQGSGKNITQSSGIAVNGSTSATFNSAGDLTLDVQTSPVISGTASGNITIAGTETPATSLTLSAGKQLAVNASVTAPTFNATAATMVEGGSGAIVSTGTSTLNASTSIALGGSNDFGTLVLQNAPSGITLKDINGVILGNATNTTGNVTLTTSATAAGNVQLGSASGDTLTFGGNLSVDNSTTANGNISQANNGLTVLGAVNLKTAGTGTINVSGASGNGVGLANQFGQVSLTTAGANATIFESTTLNLGNVSLGAGSLNAYSATSIINTGQLSLTGNILVGAGTASNPGDIALNYDSSTVHNAIGGTITLQNDLQLLAPSSTTIGTYLAKSLSVTNGISGNGTLVNIAQNVYNSTVGTPTTSANISLSAVNGANLGVGALPTSGTVSLSSDTGSITATNAANTFGALTVTSANTTGASAISTVKDLTVNGTLSGTQAIGYTSTGNVTIGNYSSSDTAATTFTATKALNDSVAGISMYGAVSFNGASVNISKAGHNFGTISVATTGNGNATITESGTSKYASANTGTGTFTATSTNGDIIQTGAVTSGNETFSAQNGNVTLTTAGNALGGTLSLTAKNSGNITNTGNTSLGNITVSSGGLTVDLSGTNDIGISEATGAKIYTYGSTVLKTNMVTANKGSISVANSGNQFGGITLSTNGGAATIKESTTLNLASVSVGTGALTVTSENGNIIDSGTVTATGTTAYSAPNGNILLTKTASDYGTVTLNTAGNVTITDANSIVLDTSTIGGTLAVTAGSTGTVGNVSQLGALTVAGASTFSLPNAGSALTLNNSANQFGAFTFNAGAGGTLIDESTTFNLLGGSSSSGAVTINTSGNFITSGTGGSTFANNLTINAPSGTITPGTNSMFVNGTFTVSGLNANLGNLSKTANLAGKDPVHTGITGTYTAPAP